MKATLEHHFDDHEYCNLSWCQFCSDPVQKADDLERQKLRSKTITEYKAMYNAVKLVHDEFRKEFKNVETYVQFAEK